MIQATRWVAGVVTPLRGHGLHEDARTGDVSETPGTQFADGRGQGSLGHRERLADGFDLLGGLDAPGRLERGLGVDELGVREDAWAAAARSGASASRCRCAAASWTPSMPWSQASRFPGFQVMPKRCSWGMSSGMPSSQVLTRWTAPVARTTTQPGP